MYRFVLIKEIKEDVNMIDEDINNELVVDIG